jgi:hypothetical protein
MKVNVVIKYWGEYFKNLEGERWMIDRVKAKICRGRL